MPVPVVGGNRPQDRRRSVNDDRWMDGARIGGVAKLLAHRVPPLRRVERPRALLHARRAAHSQGSLSVLPDSRRGVGQGRNASSSNDMLRLV